MTIADICSKVDISEDEIQCSLGDTLNILLRDHSAKFYAEKKLGKEVSPDDYRIIWATTDYVSLGDEYSFSRQITPDLITQEHSRLIVPRAAKTRQIQSGRTRDKAEVFTPSWVCNAQNNLIDEAWFGQRNVFNTENDDRTWTPTEKILFPEGKTWQKYVGERRMEITCGEAPYLVSRYDTTANTPTIISVENRIGLLDRKLRVVSENTETTGDWLKGAQNALKSTYGYEWQGDNILLARENLLFTFIDFYYHKFKEIPSTESIEYAAYIISWNIWQMNGLTYTSPVAVDEKTLEKYRQKEMKIQKDADLNGGSLFAEPENEFETQIPFCMIRDWKNNRIEPFIKSLKS